ncbi:hypothetical protein BJ138DRAFT_1164960 [Hygrophoropsis aurantiaca]|uniref:Uncharacterized protein n=1 Tax=Hygrophoropsis aurantiaca TaxID=72124 RepID=A0ACB7ZWS0_9AGAM|nr:hypothetical protein BJ138DRAFT_1164960 [Hygrophoropsis aurantiaca]
MPPACIQFIAWASLLSNTFFILWNVLETVMVQLKDTPLNRREHTYRGSDYPFHFPLFMPSAPVALTLTESVHFGLNRSDLTHRAEWDALVSQPDGYGRVQLGDEHRLFVVVFYHQMHCLWKIQLTLINRADPTATYHHVEHCLNYLRQTMMCAAADTLELGDFMLDVGRYGNDSEASWRGERMGDTMVCQDWEWAYEALGENHREWVKWREEWN